MIFSQACTYGIRAALYIASHKNGEYLPINEISKELDISFHFLTKILQKLTQKKLMKSYRGPRGGVAFARPTGQISLLEIVEAIEGDELFTQCILGLPSCGSDKPCPMHEQWGAIRDKLREVLEHTSLEELSNRVVLRGLRLTHFEKALDE